MTDQTVSSGREHAGFGVRLAAAVIDIFVLVVASYVVDFVLLVLSPSLDGHAYLLVDIAYFIYFWSAAGRGQTLGMRALHLRVVKTDGPALTYGDAFVRLLGFAIASIPLFLGWLWVIWDPQKQAVARQGGQHLRGQGLVLRRSLPRQSPCSYRNRGIGTPAVRSSPPSTIRLVALLALILAACSPTTTGPAPSPTATPIQTLSVGLNQRWYELTGVSLGFLFSRPEALRRADEAMIELGECGGLGSPCRVLDSAGVGPILEVTLRISFGDPKANNPSIKLTALGEQATADAVFQPGGVLGQLGAFVTTGPGKANQFGTPRARPPLPHPSVVVPVALSVLDTGMRSSQDLSTTDVLMIWTATAPDYWRVKTGSTSSTLNVTERGGTTYLLLGDSQAKNFQLIYWDASFLIVRLQDLPTGYVERITTNPTAVTLDFHTLGGTETQELERSSDAALLSVSVVVLFSPALASAYFSNFRLGAQLQGDREVSGPGIGDESADFTVTNQSPGTTATMALARYANLVIFGLAVTPRSNETMPLRPLVAAQIEKAKSYRQGLRAVDIPPYLPR